MKKFLEDLIHMLEEKRRLSVSEIRTLIRARHLRASL